MTQKIAGISEQDCDLAEPFAAAMCESLRAFGYDLPTALADLVDNSIFAKARNVWIDFSWNGAESTVSVTDDGHGLEEGALITAMRPGSRNPLEDRDPNDLGRFGLGLKTASFSQCRRLTVRSKTSATNVATRCWDLDFVRDTNKWLLQRTAADESERHFGRLEKLRYGTAVLWEKMDRVAHGQDVDNEIHQGFFLGRIEGVKAHLSMVFHRFIEKRKGVTVHINGRKVEAWDPFLSGEKASQRLAEEQRQYFKSTVTVIPYVLPHSSKLDSKTRASGAGIRGWNDHQGFYIYRNERLLVAGDWLGLGFTKDEHTKLARIQVDIPNSMDAHWEIDVKKSKARLPDSLKPFLKAVADKTRKRASDIYRHRGKVIARESAAPHVFAWERKVKHGKIFYAVNRDHPLVNDVIANAGTAKSSVQALLRLIEETVPVAWIVINNAEQPDKQSVPFEHAAPAQLKELLDEVFSAMLRSGLPPVEARQRVRCMEPFDRYPEVVEAAFEAIRKNGK